MVLDLAINTLFCFGAAYACGVVMRHTKYEGYGQSVGFGGIFAIVILISMHYAVEVLPGVRLDCRTPFLGLAAMVSGPLGTGIALAAALIYRTLQGGAGWMPALGASVTVVAIGLVYHYLVYRPRQFSVSVTTGFWWEWPLAGVVFSIGGLLWVLALSNQLVMPALQQLVLGVMLFYPAVCLLFGIFYRSELAFAENVVHLRQTSYDMTAALDAMADGIVQVDAQGEIQHMNKQLMGWLELSSAPLGKAFDQVIRFRDPRRRDPVESLLVIALNTGQDQISKRVVALLGSEQSMHLVQQSVRVIRDERGSIRGAVLTLEDRTESEHSHYQFTQQEKLDAVGQLAGGIAHDLNNMLAGVLGAAEQIQRKVNPDHPGHALAETIIVSAERASAVTRQLMSFSRQTPMYMQRVDIQSLIRQAMDSFERSQPNHGCSVTFKFPDALLAVMGDEGLLENVLINLVRNAVEATDLEGHLAWRLYATTIGQNERAEATAWKYVVIELADKGRGIAPHDLNSVMDPFFTTKTIGDGPGLGLSMAYGVVREHGGFMDISSEPSKGTIVRLYLPLTANDEGHAPEATGAPYAVSRNPGEASVILIGEDEEVICHSLAMYFDEMGVEAIIARDGVEAIEAYTTHRDRISVVLLDMVMPGKTGMDVFAHIHRHDVTLPVFMASGNARGDDVDGLLRDGLTGFIPKPYHLSKLQDTLAAYLPELKS